MFSRKDNDHAAQQAQEIREAEARARASAEAAAARPGKLDKNGEPAKPQRPHEIPPRAFVGNTLKQLNTVSDNYHLELAMLDKDIAKLQEERRQLIIVLDGVKLALDSINKSDSTVSVTSKILSPEERIKLAQRGNMGPTPRNPDELDAVEEALREAARELRDDAAHK